MDGLVGFECAFRLWAKKCMRLINFSYPKKIKC